MGSHADPYYLQCRVSVERRVNKKGMDEDDEVTEVWLAQM